MTIASVRAYAHRNAEELLGQTDRGKALRMVHDGWALHSNFVGADQDSLENFVRGMGKFLGTFDKNAEKQAEALRATITADSTTGIMVLDGVVHRRQFSRVMNELKDITYRTIPASVSESQRAAVRGISAALAGTSVPVFKAVNTHFS